MLFTPDEIKNGYADYCRAKLACERLYAALKNDGLLSDEKNEYGYRKLCEDAPDDAKKAYKKYIEEFLKRDAE